MKTTILIFTFLISVMLTLSACSNIAGKATARQLNANSCNADNVCEMNDAVVSKTISSVIGSNLFLKSGADAVIISTSSLPYPSGVTIGGKTISTVPGSTADLILTSDNREVIVDGNLIVNGGLNRVGLEVSNGLFSAEDASFGGNVVVAGQLSINNKNILSDASNYPYYVCSDYKGNIVSSKKPCGHS